MKLLIITQKVDKNDDLLGIYHEWVKKIAAKCESVVIICLYKGEYDLPANVTVFSMGKEKKESDFLYIINFYKHIWKLRKQYDAVFVHMNPEYAILGGLFWKIMGKKTVLWYAHYLSNLKLRLAMIFSDKIVTSIRQAFPLESWKLRVLQQGIDTDRFFPKKDQKTTSNNLRILSLGRISPVKNLETLIQSAAILKYDNFAFNLDIWGEPTSKDAAYFESIKKLIIDLDLSDKIKLLGKISTNQNPEVYLNYDLFVNLTRTGSFDKTIIESMASGLSTIVSNKAYDDILEPELKSIMIFKEKNPEDLAKKIKNFTELDQGKREEIKNKVRKIVLEKHSLDGLINKLIHALKI